MNLSKKIRAIHTHKDKSRPIDEVKKVSEHTHTHTYIFFCKV
jgi:hypothetical protein